MTHVCLGWRNSRWHRTQISQGASLLCEVSQIPHFLSNRFGVDFFSSLRPLLSPMEHASRAADFQEFGVVIFANPGFGAHLTQTS